MQKGAAKIEKYIVDVNEAGIFSSSLTLTVSGENKESNGGEGGQGNHVIPAESNWTIQLGNSAKHSLNLYCDPKRKWQRWNRDKNGE
jgi:hypothetical protein